MDVRNVFRGWQSKIDVCNVFRGKQIKIDVRNVFRGKQIKIDVRNVFKGKQKKLMYVTSLGMTFLHVNSFQHFIVFDSIW